MNAEQPASPRLHLATRPVSRLAELVVHLTGCPAPVALDAVQRSAGPVPPSGRDESLALVARAMVTVRRGIDLRD